MGSMIPGGRVRVAALLAVTALGVSGSAFAQKHSYSGDVITVDVKAQTFTVKATKSGEAPEMAFKALPGSQFFVEGERRLLGELEKGDSVVVSYGTAGKPFTAERADRVKTAIPEMMFTGDVVAIDNKAETFTVKRSAGGKVQEMMFHVSPAAHLYVGGEPVLLGQLQKGDAVTVGYETTGTVHQVKQVKK